MKKLFLLASAFFLTSSIFAQTNEVVPCHEAEIRNAYLENATPKQIDEYNQSHQELEQFTQQFIQNHPELLQNDAGNRTISYTIPVVFHVLHLDGPENISDEQIYDAMEILNRDYQLQNADANNVVSAFQGMPADIEVEFVLARKDPNGNCTKGITRTYTSYTNDGTADHNGWSPGNYQSEAVIDEHGVWPGDMYLNIFVAADIGGAAGYTRKPSWGFTDMENGIWVLQNYVGSIGTGNPSRSRTLTHEVGHWLNLDHLWGGSNNPGVSSNCSSGSDDQVQDTPECIGVQSCNLSSNTCSLDNAYWGFDQIDQVENYMEYSYCSKMFTPGQKVRMHAALNSSSGGRSTIVSATNLNETGVSSSPQVCEADFGADKVTICEGSSVNFDDLSFHAPSSWDWTFNGGSPSSSTSQNPTVTYNTAGEYEVSLTVSDGTNTTSTTKTAYIKVLPDTGQAGPVSENFEWVSSIPTVTWNTISPSNSWSLETDYGKNSSSSLKLENYNTPEGVSHVLESGTIDMSGSGSIILTFDYAYKKKSSSNNEYLRIYASSDCGDSWTVVKNFQGSSFGSGFQGTPFNQPSASDWKYEEVYPSTSLFNVSNLRFRFEFVSDDGNNFFIDNINIGRTVLSTGELKDDFGLNIYPNPVDDELLSVNFNLNDANNVAIEILDVSGRIIMNKSVANTNGNVIEKINTSQYQSGIYLMNLHVDGQVITRKFVVK